ncbi:MAG: ATP-binding protein, partial [Dermatophilaceae bacterium]
RALSDFFADTGYKLAQPLGYQESLWWAMHPGVPSGRAVREFAQITTSKALAATIPLASVTLGDSTGSLLGLNIGPGPLLGPNLPCGPTSVILHDLDGASDRHISGSMAVAGELGAGKALAVDTPIPTPSGWALMGELKPGDHVFDEQGRPTVVVQTSPVMTGHRCYEVVFSDGSTITADAEHLWTTVPHRGRQCAATTNRTTRQRGHDSRLSLAAPTENLTGPDWPRHAETVTTDQLKETLLAGAHTNHAIPTTAPLQLPTADLPITPYLLGCWLGDASSSRGVTIHSADPQLPAPDRAFGYPVTKLKAPHRYAGRWPTKPVRRPETRPCVHCGTPIACTYDHHRRYRGFRCTRAAYRARAAAADRAPTAPTGACPDCGTPLPSNSTSPRCRRCLQASWLPGRLRALGLLSDKHVPGIYLRSCVDQRRALLAGLLDTGGTVSPTGVVQFTTISHRLALDVHELACSLGYRAALLQAHATLQGRACGPVWTVSFTATDQVFRLPRKRAALTQRTVRAQPARNRFRSVVAVRETASVPVRCIHIASPSNLFLAGRAMIPTHNTATLMSLSGDVIDRGGRLIIADRTAKGEWATWAQAVTRSVVVDAADPVVSLDPLRLFGARVGSRIMQTFLTPLLNVTPTSERGVLLSDVLDPAYMSRHRLGSCGELLAHLHDGCALPGAGELARLVNVFARRDLGRVIFDGSIPPLDLAGARAVVIRTHTLMLPSREELEHEHLFKQLGLEKIFGRALNALIAALARHVCFADTSVLAGFVVSEAHSMTISFEGERELVEFVRDGRKHRAVVLLDSHDPQADFGSATLRGLIPTRILMRHRDKTLAQRGLAWLDLDEHDEDLLELVRTDLSPVVGGTDVPEHRRGECLMRDMSGNVGRAKILLPAMSARNEAIRAAGAAAVRE